MRLRFDELSLVRRSVISTSQRPKTDSRNLLCTQRISDVRFSPRRRLSLSKPSSTLAGCKTRWLGPLSVCSSSKAVFFIKGDTTRSSKRKQRLVWVWIWEEEVRRLSRRFQTVFEADLPRRLLHLRTSSRRCFHVLLIFVFDLLSNGSRRLRSGAAKVRPHVCFALHASFLPSSPLLPSLSRTSIISPEGTITELPDTGENFESGSSSSSSPESALFLPGRTFKEVLESTHKSERAYRHHLDHIFDDRLCEPTFRVAEQDVRSRRS